MKFVQHAFLCFLLSVVSIPANASHLGVNFNGIPNIYNLDDLQRTNTEWVRAFYDVTNRMSSASGCTASSIQSDPNLNALLAIHNAPPQRYRIALNLKYDFHGAQPPASTTAAFNNVVACTNLILARIYPSIDTLVSGNEPFITNQPSDENVTTFYEAITDNDISYNKMYASTSVTGKEIPLYVGAFNNLEEASFQTQPVEDLIAYASNNPDVTGIDLHLHVASFEQLKEATKFARTLLGPNKPMMSSEFSLVNYFSTFLDDSLSSKFLAHYSNAAGQSNVLGFINYALANPVPKTEWDDFLNDPRNSPRGIGGNGDHPRWFVHAASGNPETWESTFLAKTKEFFDTHQFTIETFAIYQSAGQLPTNTPMPPQPFLLNALFCNVTCIANPADGDARRDLDWLGDFKQLQY